MRRPKLSRLGASWAASVSLHALMMGALGWVVAQATWTRAPEAPPAPAPNASEDIAIELPGAFVGEAIDKGPTVPEGATPTPAGGELTPRLDTERAGKGGGPASERAIHLADRDEGEILTPDLRSRLDRDQIQRLETARTRASFEDRRATPEPMELTFLAIGSGDTRERRPKSANPSRGAARAQAASVLGGLVGSAQDEGERALSGAAQVGALTSSPGAGVRHESPGADHRASAHVATGKPDVQRAKVTVPATEKDRPRDTIDSTQEVSLAVQSIVHASGQGGAPGLGIGGSDGAGQPGAGAQSGAGSHPAPLGQGLGDWFDLDTQDARLLPYFRKIRAKVNPLWSFPKSAALELKQGTVILEVTILEDGAATVKWPPWRPSGIDEFDRNCADAFRRAQPFEPIPKALGVRELHIRAPFSSPSAASWAP